MDLHVSYQRRTFQSIYSRYLEHFIIYEIRLSIYLLRFVRVYISANENGTSISFASFEWFTWFLISKHKIKNFRFKFHIKISRKKIQIRAIDKFACFVSFFFAKIIFPKINSSDSLVFNTHTLQWVKMLEHWSKMVTNRKSFYSQLKKIIRNLRLFTQIYVFFLSINQFSSRTPIN